MVSTIFPWVFAWFLFPTQGFSMSGRLLSHQLPRQQWLSGHDAKALRLGGHHLVAPDKVAVKLIMDDVGMGQNPGTVPWTPSHSWVKMDVNNTQKMVLIGIDPYPCG